MTEYQLARDYINEHTDRLYRLDFEGENENGMAFRALLGDPDGPTWWVYLHPDGSRRGIYSSQYGWIDGEHPKKENRSEDFRSPSP